MKGIGMGFRQTVIALAVVAAAAPRVFGQATASAPAAQSGPAPLRISISGRALEKPDLKFALLAKVEDMSKGNAAPKYLAALTLMPELKAEEGAKIADAAGTMSLDALDAQDWELNRLIEQHRQALRILREGSRLESADWETDVRQGGISTLLPWLGKTRTLARVLAVQIRMEIKHHDWAAARDDLQTGYALARHLGQGETLIESLVGVAVAETMDRCVEDWISQVDSPNLYWPLANVPAPFNDLRRAFSFERGLVFNSLPEMKEMRDGHYSAGDWNRLWIKMMGFSRDAGLVSNAQPFGYRGQELLGPAAGVAMYPQAKLFLMERGLTKAEVEKMAVAEVLGRYFVRSFEESSDEFFKSAGLPWPEAMKGMQEAEKGLQKGVAAGTENFLARILMPALTRPVFLGARLDRHTDMLRIAEALRAYAAAKGELPASLGAVELPIPLDPTTGQAFGYQRQGNKATVSSPKSDYGEGATLEITLRK